MRIPIPPIPEYISTQLQRPISSGSKPAQPAPNRSLTAPSVISNLMKAEHGSFLQKPILSDDLKGPDKTTSYWINQIDIPKHYWTHEETIKKAGLANLSENLKDKLKDKLKGGLSVPEAFDKGFVTDSDRTLLEKFWIKRVGSLTGQTRIAMAKVLDEALRKTLRDQK